MVMQIKTFTGELNTPIPNMAGYSTHLEVKVNPWLKENAHLKILDIKFTGVGRAAAVMIVYDDGLSSAPSTPEEK